MLDWVGVRVQGCSTAQRLGDARVVHAWGGGPSPPSTSAVGGRAVQKTAGIPLGLCRMQSCVSNWQGGGEINGMGEGDEIGRKYDNIEVDRG